MNRATENEMYGLLSRQTSKLIFASSAGFLLFTTSVVAAPKLISILPNPIKSGEQLTITGQGMEEINSVNIGSKVIEDVSIASSYGITCTQKKHCKSGILQVLKIQLPQSMDAGTYKLSISNTKGRSQSLNLKID